MKTGIELFQELDRSVEELMRATNYTYLEALMETGENLLDDGQANSLSGRLPSDVREKLETMYQEIAYTELTPEVIRQGMQLAILRGMRESYLQPNHQMTPDSIGILLAYLAEVIARPEKDLALADLTAGTGNLLLTVHHFLKTTPDFEREIQLTGVDNDEFLLSLASMQAALQRTPVKWMLQDALRPLLLAPVDIAVSDLPIGYYPDDEHAAGFHAHLSEGHSYSHYLLIEQQLKYLKDGGFGFFVVPTSLFEDEQISALLKAINAYGYLQAVIELPHNIFKNEKSRKSVVVIQRSGGGAKQAETLAASAPEFKDVEQMKEFLSQVKKWRQENFE